MHVIITYYSLTKDTNITISLDVKENKFLHNVTFVNKQKEEINLKQYFRWLIEYCQKENLKLLHNPACD